MKNVAVERETHRELKRWCIDTDTSLQVAVERAVREFLARYAKTTKGSGR